MYKIIAFASLFIWFSIKGYAEKELQKGFIITNNLDTVHGFIDYKEWDINPALVKFYKNTQSEPVIYNPTEIYSFFVNGDLYKGGIVQKEISPIEVGELNYYSDLKFEVDTIFLKTIFDGPKPLYYYKDNNFREYFYIEGEGERNYDLLVFKVYLKEIDGTDYNYEVNKYKGQLVLYFENCAEIQTGLESLKYNLRTFKKLFNTYYNKCDSKESITYIEENKTIDDHFHLIAGVSFTSANFVEGATEGIATSLPYNDIDFQSSLDFSGGIGYEIVLSRTNKKFSIFNELLFQQYSFNESYRDGINDFNYTDYTISFSNSYLKVFSNLRYYFLGINNGPFAEIGFTNGFSLGLDQEVIEDPSFGATTEKLMTNNVSNYEIGGSAGVGVNFYNLSVLIRQEFASGFIQDIDVGDRLNRLYILLSYRPF